MEFDIGKPTQDLIGQKMGRLHIMGRIAGTHNIKAKFKVKCECGTEFDALCDNVKRGTTKSCGCLKRELTSTRNSTHGHSRTTGRRPEYRVWCTLKERCENPKNKSYGRYGARGIRVCGRWKKYENFISDMGDRPKGRMTIERKNNDGDYSPSNCKWATYATQARNTSSVVLSLSIVKKIKQMKVDGYRAIETARILHASYTAVYDVWRGKTWREI